MTQINHLAERLQAYWHATLLKRALCVEPDLATAQAAAAAALAIQPFPDETDLEKPDDQGEDWGDEGGGPPGQQDGVPVDAFFAFDIWNKRAQGILNRALTAAKKLSAAARLELESALRLKEPAAMAAKVAEFLARYRLQLANLLGTTQLAALLEGAREVVRHIPGPIPSISGAGAVPPPSLPPEDAQKLLDRLRKLSTSRQEEEIYKLPPEQQNFARLQLAATPPAPSLFSPPRPPTEGEIQFPIIEEAARELAQKNLVGREAYDRLDAAARAKAFTVTGVDEQETLAKIRDALAENIEQEPDFETFRKKMLQSVDEGTFLSEGHLETVFRANVQGAFSDAQMEILKHPFIRSGFPYAAYEAIHDDRVRDEHLALEKYGIEGSNVYRIEDPVFQTFRPNWDFGCRCSYSPMTVRQAAEKGITEAQKWMQDGVEPYPPQFVAMPPFQPPPSFRRGLESVPLSLRLSLQPIQAQPTEEEATNDLFIATGDSAAGQGQGLMTAGTCDHTPEPARSQVDRKPAKMKYGRTRHGKRGKRMRFRIPKSWRKFGIKAQLAVQVDPRNRYHGPEAPGPGWVEVATGPRGGKIWEFKDTAPEKPQTQKQQPAQQSLPEMKTVRNLGGSTGARLVKSPDGKDMVVKSGGNAAQLQEEFAADKAYQALGVPVPAATLYNDEGKPAKVAEFINGTSLPQFLQSASAGQKQGTLNKLKSGFAADALLANWDVVGGGGQNIIVDAQGTPWRIDNGGSMRFRARGGSKAFGPEVAELSTLRDPKINPDAASIFGSLTPDQIASQVHELAGKREQLLESLPPELRDTVSARLDDMIRQVGPAKPKMSPEEAAADYKANGVKAKSFKGWFGDWEGDPENSSKVVGKDGVPEQNHRIPGQGSLVRDQEGKPRVVYHGTPKKDWYTFDKSKLRDPDALVYGPGFYFANDQAMADTFNVNKETGERGETKAVYLNIRNPFDMDREYTKEEYQQITGKKWGIWKTIGRFMNQKKTGTITGQDLYQELAGTGRKLNRTAAAQKMAQAGYDGITHTAGAYGGKGTGKEDDRVWVAFEPNQVKSTDNLGTFDSGNADIRMGLDITLGMVGDEWHGPKPPGDPGMWMPIKAGPRGGKRWKLKAGAQRKQRTVGQRSPTARPSPDQMAQKIQALVQSGKLTDDSLAQVTEELLTMTVKDLHAMAAIY